MNRRGSRALALGALVVGAGALALVMRAAAPSGPSALPTAAVGAPLDGDEPPPPAFDVIRRRVAVRAVPDDDALRRARAWLRGREGRTAFAFADSRGHVRGVRIHDRFHSASLVKAMLLTAYLQRVAAQHRRLSASERALLDPMIRVSDNDAASAIFGDVGEDGLERLAEQVGMTDFEANAAWGWTEVSAADQARFFAALDRLVPRASAAFARDLLSGIAPEQSWGIPMLARPAGFRVYFKGGWLDGIVNQAARLERADATIAIAVLTDENHSMGYGIDTIEGVTAALLAKARRPT